MSVNMSSTSVAAVAPHPVPAERADTDSSHPNDDVAYVATTEQVVTWLNSLGLSQYADPFTRNDIDGQLLRTLTSTELRDDLSVINLQHRRTILSNIQALPSLTSPPTPPASISNSSSSNSFKPSIAPFRLSNAIYNYNHKMQINPSDKLPEHGRILDHLSNVRTYHSWLRVGIQFLSFAIVILRLAPDLRYTNFISGVAFYFGAVATFSFFYGLFRYRRVIRMIEYSQLSKPVFQPDFIGTASIVVLILCAAVLSIVIISLPAPSS